MIDHVVASGLVPFHSPTSLSNKLIFGPFSAGIQAERNDDEWN
jgi:hypothetical protein